MFDLLGSRDVIGHVTIGLGVGTFILVVNDDHASILHRYGIRGFKDFGVTSLTFWGHVTSSITWPSDLAWALSYWWSMMTMHLSCIYSEIRGFKDFVVTSLTIWGHVVGENHRLNGSSSPVLTATSLSYGKAKNSTPHRIKTCLLYTSDAADE